MNENIGLYAVFDAVSGEQKTESMSYFKARDLCAILGGKKQGYVIGFVNNPPKPKESVNDDTQGFEPKEPGLFDF
jgi:hypothetical protein